MAGKLGQSSRPGQFLNLIRNKIRKSQNAYALPKTSFGFYARLDILATWAMRRGCDVTPKNHLRSSSFWLAVALYVAISGCIYLIAAGLIFK